MKKLLLLLVVCIFSFFLLSFRNTSVPPGVNGDESGIAYNAVLISRNLRDENNHFLPLFIFAKTSDWKQPVTVYATALVFRLFGPSLANLRDTSVLFVIISIVIFYFLVEEMFDFKFFVVGFLVLITVPIIMIQSHLALENIAVLPFIFFWILMLAKNKKASRPAYLFLAGASLGIGIFSYLAMRIVVPVLSLITLVYLRKNFKKILYFLLGLTPFLILLCFAYFRYPGAVLGHYSAPIPSVNEFLLRYLSTFDLSFLFMKGDSFVVHSTGKAGMFLVATLPIFLIGIWKMIKNKKPFEILILSSFFLTPIMFGFVPDIYRASRLLALIPFYVIISTIGFLAVPRKFGLAIVVLMLANYLYFAQDYWFKYPARVDQVFPIKISYYNNDFTKK
jgi:4-amino-4-deoxy-L-arabinose transferase-like glycosyltransferase